MLRMNLIRLLRRLIGKDKIERDLIRLIHDRARAGRHFADVKVQHAGNVFQIFVRAGDEFIRRVRLRRIRPKYYDV